MSIMQPLLETLGVSEAAGFSEIVGAYDRRILHDYGPLFYTYAPRLTRTYGKLTASLTRYQSPLGEPKKRVIPDNLTVPLDEYMLIGYRFPSVKRNGNGTAEYMIMSGQEYLDEEETIGKQVLGTNGNGLSSLVGTLSENIAWPSVFEWINSLEGRVDLGFPPAEEGIINRFRHYTLEIKDYPNLIVRDNIQGRERREFDGFFVLEQGEDRYGLMLETKTRGLPGMIQKFDQEVFDVLSSMYDLTHLIYVFYTDLKSLYTRPDKKSSNILRSQPQKILGELMDMHVGSIFFGFRDFHERDVRRHLRRLYKARHHMHVRLPVDVENGTRTIWLGDMPLEIWEKTGPNTLTRIPTKY